MARNWVQPGNTITIPAAATVAGGEVVVTGGIVGVAAGDAASGAPLDVHTDGVWTLPKVSALAIAVGDVLYYDSASKLVSKTSAGNTKIGVAVTAAANPSGTVRVRLSGF